MHRCIKEKWIELNVSTVLIASFLTQETKLLPFSHEAPSLRMVMSFWWQKPLVGGSLHPSSSVLGQDFNNLIIWFLFHIQLLQCSFWITAACCKIQWSTCHWFHWEQDTKYDIHTRSAQRVHLNLVILNKKVLFVSENILCFSSLTFWISYLVRVASFPPGVSSAAVYEYFLSPKFLQN